MFNSCVENGAVEPSNLADYSLILPAVSIGNVGQLTIDLVISALSTSRQLIGYLHDASILPVVGNDAFAKPGQVLGELNISAEAYPYQTYISNLVLLVLVFVARIMQRFQRKLTTVFIAISKRMVQYVLFTAVLTAVLTPVYKSTEHRLVVVQQRAPIAKGHYAAYCHKLIEWIKHCAFKQVVLLSSISATYRVDAQMQGSPLRYLLAPSSQHLKKTFDQLLWTHLEKKPKYPDISSGQKEFVFSLSGGGVTNRLYENCCKAGISLTVLLAFCSEGDNIADALTLFLNLNDWLCIIDKNKVEAKFAGKPSDFVIPASWSLMFGSPLQQVPLF